MDLEYSPNKIEKKWTELWKESNLYDSDPSDEGKPYFVNVAYPYPSGSMHVGHGRTYTLPDIIARFKRMNGYNVLFPMAWHVTGTPVIGISRRIEEDDKGTIKLYKNLYGVPHDTLEKFTDPIEIVNYFSSEYKKIMDKMGYSIDWRREFKTTDKEYKKFITWQFNKLKEKNLIDIGTHPVKYCPNDENALGDHDLLEGEEAEIDSFYLIKFRLKSGQILPCATLRPETIFGATNIWINPDSSYVLAEVEGEEWILSHSALKKIKEQDKNASFIENIDADTLIGETAESPTSKKVPVLPAEFVNDEVASGVVMSVPAHAPFDLAAILDLEKKGYLKKLGINGLKPVKVINTEGYGTVPAGDAMESAGIKEEKTSNIQIKMNNLLEEATEEIYEDEFIKGQMSKEIDNFSGIRVREARDLIGENLINENNAEKMYEFTKRPVTCRCGEDAIVKILSNQWFINYNNPEWKDITRESLDSAELIPKEIKKDFKHTIGWLEEWACSRKVGLGTNLPWDEEWIIEPLSDSTLYMAYYTISNILKDVDCDPTESLFSYIFLGEGNINEVVNDSGIEKEVLVNMREEFKYWYPYDFRFSAKDLIQNHLTFQLFHHTAIFSEEFWPKGISVCGMGLLEGQKMSSSKGNVVLLEDAIDEYGADTVRFFLASSAEPWQDFDWREEAVKSANNDLRKFWNGITHILIEKQTDIPNQQERDLRTIDEWIISRYNKTIEETRQAMEKHQTRKALQNSFYEFRKDIKWYKRRAGKNKNKTINVLQNIYKGWIKLLAPFIPFMSEEIWNLQSDESKSIFRERYPVADKNDISELAETQESFIKNTLEDINEIISVTGKNAEKITIFTASEWKWKVLEKAYNSEKQNFGELMSLLMKDSELREKGSEVKDVLRGIIEDIRGLTEEELNILLKTSEFETISNGGEFLSEELGCEIEILGEEDSDNDKASEARPMRPAIYIE